MLWTCDSCGAEFPEPGDRSGYGQVMSHLRGPEGKGHHIRGLIEQGSGELLVRGTNIKGAIAAGYVEGKPPEQPREEGGEGGKGFNTRQVRIKRTLAGRHYVADGHRRPIPPAGPRSSPEMGHEIPAPLTGVMSAYTLVFPPEMLGLYSLCREYMVKRDGAPFGWEPDDVNAWVWEVVREFVEFFIPRAVVKEQGYVGKMAEFARQQVLERIRRVEGLPPEAFADLMGQAIGDALTTQKEGA